MVIIPLTTPIKWTGRGREQISQAHFSKNCQPEQI
jgi:hypothetical protein